MKETSRSQALLLEEFASGPVLPLKTVACSYGDFSPFTFVGQLKGNLFFFRSIKRGEKRFHSKGKTGTEEKLILHMRRLSFGAIIRISSLHGRS